MRIVSKFRDYYDGLADYTNKDRLNYVWTRKQETVEIHRTKVSYLETRARFVASDCIVPLFLIIAGKVFPVLRDFSGNKSKYLYSKEQTEKHQPKFIKKSVFYNNREAFFDEYPDFSWLNIELNSPIVVFNPWKHKHFYQGHLKETREVDINASLHYYQFTTVMHPYEIYQMLDQFVSNNMIKDEMPEYPRTDIEKLESHGFDKKVSFRNRK